MIVAGSDFREHFAHRVNHFRTLAFLGRKHKVPEIKRGKVLKGSLVFRFGSNGIANAFSLRIVLHLLPVLMDNLYSKSLTMSRASTKGRNLASVPARRFLKPVFIRVHFVLRPARSYILGIFWYFLGPSCAIDIFQSLVMQSTLQSCQSFKAVVTPVWWLPG